MVVDSSALLAVLLGEPEADEFIGRIASASDPVMSAASLVETSIVLDARVGHGGVDALDALLATASVRVIAVDERQARVARAAYSQFGKGRAKAALNFGDCFSYALAIVCQRPLLFKGDDFGHTDVRSARAA